MTSNSQNYIKEAANLYKGELSDNNEALKVARDARNGTLWNIICNLICHAAINVFNAGYTRKIAANFKADVVTEFEISEKQAGKYTESISAALGVRGLRAGIEGMDGLRVSALEGVKAVEDYLKLRDINTFNQFMAAVRVDTSPEAAIAAKLHKLGFDSRDKVAKLVKQLDDAKGLKDAKQREKEARKAAADASKKVQPQAATPLRVIGAGK